MTNAAERFAQLPSEKRDRLLDPAEAEFIDRGYDAASLNRVLSNAGMSKGQAYHYITGKSDLYLWVCKRRFLPLLEQAESCLRFDQGAEFWSVVEGCSAALVEKLEADPALSSLARGVYDSAAASTVLVPLAERVDALLNRAIDAGRSADVIRDDLPRDMVRDMLKGAAISLDRWFARFGPTLDPTEAEHATHGALEMLRNMVAPVEGGRDATDA
ncbi:TetR/AcrR family transcriptional regulator [Jannaschia sp. CCS1]|uniref:TetR/AcrR family transcriptional regulator n=1 Tax=Jannaschia sp. (strain CCS1) TaxID=290400 RepID=UPI00006BFFF0|nr:TetR/AcrR family transcriptional regulator [Jannaschia sp. CCS1]ABD54467.1 transcriptional regulator, TetR family [Jannaschia sp. CCS1]